MRQAKPHLHHHKVKSCHLDQLGRGEWRERDFLLTVRAFTRRVSLRSSALLSSFEGQCDGLQSVLYTPPLATRNARGGIQTHVSG